MTHTNLTPLRLALQNLNDFFFRFLTLHIMDLTILTLLHSLIRQTHSHTNEVNVHNSISGEYLHIYNDDEKAELPR